MNYKAKTMAAGRIARVVCVLICFCAVKVFAVEFTEPEVEEKLGENRAFIVGPFGAGLTAAEQKTTAAQDAGAFSPARAHGWQYKINDNLQVNFDYGERVQAALAEKKPLNFAVLEGFGSRTTAELHGNYQSLRQSQAVDGGRWRVPRLGSKLRFGWGSIFGEADAMMQNGRSLCQAAMHIGAEWEYEDWEFGDMTSMELDYAILRDVYRLGRKHGASVTEIGIAAKKALWASDRTLRNATTIAAAFTSFIGGSKADVQRVVQEPINTGFFLHRGRLALDGAFANQISRNSWSKNLINPDPGFQRGDQIRYDTPRLAFGGTTFQRSYQQSEVIPNDPLYLKGGQTAKGSKLKSGAKKVLGFGLKIGGVGFGGSDGDKKADDQWGLHKVGFTPRSDPASAWNLEDGSRANVVVAVIDSGLDFNHPDGPPHVWTNAKEIPGNGKDDDRNGYVDDIHGWNFLDENNDMQDDYGHGTFVAGIIAANRNNGEGIAGINPGARLMVLKVGDRDSKPRDLNIYRAIRYAVDNGAMVLNISLGSKHLSRLEQIAINYAHAMGRVVVVAAGNQGKKISQYGPPGARRAFAVASMDISGERRKASNQGFNVALAAPGESIYSLSSGTGKRDGQIMPMMNTKYHRLNGTSFAAPFVAGAASLLWAKYPGLTNHQVEDMLVATAADMETPGWDRGSGAGRLDARRLLALETAYPFVVRVTEVFTNWRKRKVASVDLYGVIRGGLAQYSVAIAKGAKPKKWQTVIGPVRAPVDHAHIGRIDGALMRKGAKWSVRVTGVDRSGQSQAVTFVVATRPQ